MDLIYDMKIMNKSMAQIGYDAKKMPLGKLGSKTITEGYNVLKEIEAVLKKKKKGDLFNLSSRFFTLIPHDFGFKPMSNFVINTLDKLQAKVDMVESLGQIEITSKIIEDSKNKDDIIGQQYKKLNCDIKPIDHKSKEFKVIQDYLSNTKLGEKATLVNAFELERQGENKRFLDYKNNFLLWHGSRITNFVGILSQGLRIAPPESPASGYRFGKGCYFADMACKSLNYCSPVDNTALILLCEVSVGKPNITKSGDCNFCKEKLPKGTHSTKYIGTTFPPENTYLIKDGVIIPLGNPGSKSSWDFNEYIVYDVAQVKMKYLLRLKYN